MRTEFSEWVLKDSSLWSEEGKEHRDVQPVGGKGGGTVQITRYPGECRSKEDKSARRGLGELTESLSAHSGDNKHDRKVGMVGRFRVTEKYVNIILGR